VKSTLIDSHQILQTFTVSYPGTLSLYLCCTQPFSRRMSLWSALLYLS